MGFPPARASVGRWLSQRSEKEARSFGSALLQALAGASGLPIAENAETRVADASQRVSRVSGFLERTEASC